MMPPQNNRPSESQTIPIQFGKFEIMGEIGRGAYGVVYRALHKDLGRTVAIKFILDAHEATEEDIRDFEAEAAAQAKAQHPHIVPFFGAGKEHGRHYIYMKHLHGPDLATRVTTNPPDVRLAAQWMAALARALHHLHEHKLIHLDLKPENIVLDHEGRPHLIDFGLAKMFTGGQYMHEGMGIRGTPSYMAPEQADDRKPDIGPLTDVYGLGAILYSCITRRPPFDDDDPMKTLDKVSQDPLVPPRAVVPSIPLDLEKICVRAMQKNPADRYPSAEALADDLERFLRGEPITEGKLPKLTFWMRLRRVLPRWLGGKK